MVKLPNHGVKWILGCYKIEITVCPTPLDSRNLVIENLSGVTGLYHEDIFSQIHTDIDALKATVMDLVSKANEEAE